MKLSRVSVWKQINKLIECGYKIESSSTGYKIGIEPDLLYPWEFDGLEKSIHFFHETDSTMSEAHKLVEQNCPDKTIVIAERQNKGRGRLTRSWVSENGGLYFTYILKPGVPYTDGWYYNFAVSLSLVKVLKNLYSIDAAIKWPNDILVPEKSNKEAGRKNYFGSKKIAGILSDMQIEADVIKYLSIGIGLNVNNNPSEKLPDSCSVKQITGVYNSRKELLKEFLIAFERYLTDIDKLSIINEWKSYSIINNSDVKVVTPKETVFGKTADIDNEGALVLRLKNGTIKRILYGDCFPVQNSE